MGQGLRARAAMVVLVCAVALTAAGPARSATSYDVSSIATPGQPFAMVVDSVAHRGYVAQTQPGVLVLDTESKQLLGTIPFDGSVAALAVDPDRHRVYVSMIDRTLVEIDTESRSVVRRTVVGVVAQRMVVDPGSHKVYVITGSSNLTVLDPDASRNPVATISLPGFPVRLATDPGRQRVYVTAAFAPGVLVIDTATDSMVATFQAGPGSIAVAVDPAASRLYVTDVEDRTVRVLSTEDGRPLASFADPEPSPPAEIALDPGAQSGYVAHNGSGTVTVFDTAAETVRATVATGAAPSTLAVDIGTHEAFLPAYPERSITVITPVTTPELQVATFVSTPPTDPAVGTSYRVLAAGSPTGLRVVLRVATSSANVCRFVGAASGQKSVVSPARVRFTAPGTCTITARQQGDRDHQPSPRVSQTIVVPR